MTRKEERRLRVEQHPRRVSFRELDDLLRAYGFQRRQPRRGSSHYIYVRERWQICVPRHRPHVKEHYVRAVLSILDEVESEAAENRGLPG